MKTQAMDHLREAVLRRHGMPFVDFIRTHYWASFNILPVVAEKCGLTLEELRRLMDEDAWELQKPPSLDRQNRPVADLELLDAVSRPEKRVDTFVRDFAGSPAFCPTRVMCYVEKDRLRLNITCFDAHVQDVSLVAPEAIDPDAEILWSGNTEALKNTAAWEGGRDQFRKWVMETGDRKRSIFSADCVAVTLCAVAAGECPAYLAPVRHVRNPLPVLANPPKRIMAPRIHLEGSYYIIAIAPTGQIAGAFYDPWEGGVFWPCWESGAQAEVSCREDGWALDVTVPLANLEPLPVRDSVWGIDFFRGRPVRGNEPAEWTRAADSIFFRQTDNELGEGRFLSTPEEFGQPGPRHAYIASELPFVDRIVPRDLPAIDVRPVPADSDHRKDEFWAEIEAAGRFWLDQTGAEPEYETVARVAHDAQALYVRFDSYDDDTANLRVVTKEEELAKYGDDNRRANYLDRREAFGLDWGDYVEIQIAPGTEDADIYHGGYYNILVNSRGDVLTRYTDPYGAYALSENDAWDPDLQVSIRTRGDHWETLLAVPFAALHGVDRGTGTWRCNFKRARGTRDASNPSCKGSEISAWSPEYGRCRLLERLGFLHFKGPVLQVETAGLLTVPGDTDEGIERKTSPTAVDDTLAGIHFPSPDKGWAVGGLGTILHTSDRGATWAPQRANTDYALEKVLFLDELRGFAVGGRPRSQRIAINGTAGCILATSDGGENWQTVLRNEAAHLFDVSFVSERVGYAVGGYGVVLKTTDSGGTWQHLANTGTDCWLMAVHFVDEEHGWAVGEEGVVVATADGGRTWQCRVAPTGNAPFGLPASLRAVHFVNLREGWAAGNRGTFLRTVDGGRSWQPVDLGLSYPATDVMHFNAVRFLGEQTGILAGEPGSVVFRTGDGGHKWHREVCPVSAGLRDICFDGQGQPWAAGEFGALARRTKDGWEQVAGASIKPRLLYGTPHGHHVNSTCWGALVDDYDIVLAIGGRSINLGGRYEEQLRANTTAGCLEVGMRGIRTMMDMPGGRRREPHRICHLYQNWQGVELAERRLAAVLRSMKPRVVIAEWPILQEGYWAADVGLFARALIRAFDSAADPERFPELAQLGLAPWRPERLFVSHLHLFSEVYRIGHRKDWTVSAKENDFVKATGMRVGEARYRGRCNWAGLLDRARPRAPGPLGDYRQVSSFHLLTDHGQ